MSSRKKASLEKELLELFSRHFESLPSNPWADERERWLELVVCTLFTHGGSSRGKSRQAAHIFKELGLLEIENLAAIPIRQGVMVSDHSSVMTMTQILRQMGFASKDISPALTKTVMLAKAVCIRFGGKIQRYLRSYGEAMLAHLEKDFPEIFVSKKKRAAHEDTSWRFAFALWLQNSLTLPVFLDTANTRRFCRHAVCRMTDLQEAADRLDINASLLDDLLDLWATEEDQKKNPAGKGR
ncbi:MAG: hypothetical protein NTW38_00575 [Candidatus Aminicenantes bacterium]|nr:hypothetical protein [Candidatus Aminicenantes bacterium]